MFTEAMEPRGAPVEKPLSSEVLDFFLVLAQLLEEILILASNGHYGGVLQWRIYLHPQ